jgi:hypothetical protein
MDAHSPVGGGGVAPHRMGPERDTAHCLRGRSTGVDQRGASRSADGGAQLTIAASWCVVLCNKGVLHLRARGHQEAPTRQ